MAHQAPGWMAGILVPKLVDPTPYEGIRLLPESNDEKELDIWKEFPGEKSTSSLGKRIQILTLQRQR